MIKVAIYCRVSTDKADQANSFEAQQRYFCQYIRDHPDWELYGIYADEGITGTSTKKRTQFNRMINDAYDGKFRIIVTKEVSRFSRNVLDTIAYTRELKAIGVGVIFADDRIDTLKADGEMLLSFLASLAQEESRRTSSRVVWGQTRQMEKGIVFGRSLLGYDVKGGILTIDEEGAEIVRLIYHLYALEQLSTTEVARRLRCKGVSRYRYERSWKASSVIKILKNEKYVGDLVQKKTYTPDFLSHEKRTNKGEVPFVIIRNHHEPIISREVWDLAQERLQKNNKHGAAKEGHSNRYVFSGRIRCGECGRSFVGRFKYLKDGTKIRRWSCGTAVGEGAAACGVGKLVRDDDAIQMLKISIRSLPMDFESMIKDVTELVMGAVQEDTGENFRQSQFGIERLRQKRETVMDSFFSGEITKEDMQALCRKYDEQMSELNRWQRESGEKAKVDFKVLRETLQSEVFGILNGDIESEVFYKSILEQLTVFKDRHMELRLQYLPQIFWFIG